MHEHHMDILIAELASERYRGLSPDAALSLVNSKATIARLSRMPPSLTDQLRAAFPTGVPGFPNRVRVDEFRYAWQQAGR